MLPILPSRINCMWIQPKSDKILLLIYNLLSINDRKILRSRAMHNICAWLGFSIRSSVLPDFVGCKLGGLEVGDIAVALCCCNVNCCRKG